MGHNALVVVVVLVVALQPLCVDWDSGLGVSGVNVAPTRCAGRLS